MTRTPDDTPMVSRDRLETMRCTPCLAASTFGGEHHCTGHSSNRAAEPCPCCGTGAADAV